MVNEEQKKEIRRLINKGALLYTGIFEKLISEFSYDTIKKIKLTESENIFLLLGYQNKLLEKK